MAPIKSFSLAVFLTITLITGLCFAADTTTTTGVATSQIFDKVKQNNNWKVPFLTAKNAQVVFMAVSPKTNPKNEIGVETHQFDQIIFVVEGNAKAVLGNDTKMVKAGDMIFIPQGVEHNVINQNANKALKILSVYTATDMPADQVLQKKSDAKED